MEKWHNYNIKMELKRKEKYIPTRKKKENIQKSVTMGNEYLVREQWQKRWWGMRSQTQPQASSTLLWMEQGWMVIDIEASREGCWKTERCLITS